MNSMTKAMETMGSQPHSVLDAIKMGIWDFDPESCREDSEFVATRAMPGSTEKISVLAERLAKGLPLWHPSDRQTYDEVDFE